MNDTAQLFQMILYWLPILAIDGLVNMIILVVELLGWITLWNFMEYVITGFWLLLILVKMSSVSTSTRQSVLEFLIVWYHMLIWTSKKKIGLILKSPLIIHFLKKMMVPCSFSMFVGAIFISLILWYSQYIWLRSTIKWYVWLDLLNHMFFLLEYDCRSNIFYDFIL